MLLSPTAIGAVTEILDASDFYRESHAIVYRACARAVGEGRAGRRDHAHQRAGGARRARAGRRHGQGRRARCARPGHVERRALRADRQGDGDAARAHPRRAGDRAARPGSAGRHRRPRRPGRADRLRPLPAARHRRLLAHRVAPQGELRADHAPLRGGRRPHGRPVRLPRARPAHVGLPARQPDHPRRASVDGEVGARALHRREPRRAAEHAGRAVHARDVEVRGDAADDVQRGEGRVEPAALRQARARRLAAAHRGLRQADEGADLRRRHRLDHDDGAALEGAAAQVARAEARPDRRRLPPADDLRRELREPGAGGVADLAEPEGARPRPRRADPRALAALARRRAAHRQATDALRPARIGLDRAGRRPRRSSSTATSTTTRRSRRRRGSPR